MERLPLYDAAETFPGGVGPVPGAPRQPACRRCSLGIAAKHPCLVGAEGAPGGLLVVGESPTQQDDILGGVMSQGHGKMLLEALQRAQAERPRIVWALGCPSGRTAPEGAVAACRPYLAGEFARGPARAILLGPVAAEAALGVAFNPASTRRGWAVIRGVPCFLVMSPGQAAYNRFLKRQFEADVQWAVQVPAPAAPAGAVLVAHEAVEALDLLRGIQPGRALAVDCEHYPKSPWSKEPLEVLCVGLCQDPERPFVLPGQVFLDPEVLEAFRRVMADSSIPKINQDIKHDRHVIWRAFGVEVEGIAWDTLLCSRLMESDAPAGLARTSWRVGMGGYKEQGQLGADDEDE